jgi:hypothetical protein
VTETRLKCLLDPRNSCTWDILGQKTSEDVSMADSPFLAAAVDLASIFSDANVSYVGNESVVGDDFDDYSATHRNASASEFGFLDHLVSLGYERAV